MREKQVLLYCKENLQNKVDKFDCTLTHSKKYELNLESGEVQLLRTTINNSLKIMVIKNNKKGNITLNKIDNDSIDEAIKNVLDICENSEPDPAFDIAGFQEPKEFSHGDSEPDLPKMFDLLQGYVVNVKEKYPTIKLMDTLLSFDNVTKYYVNSNGVDFTETSGEYSFSSNFAAKENNKSSSFNYSWFSLAKLEDDLLNCGSLDTVLRQTTQQIETKAIDGKFTGDIIIAPDCVAYFVYAYIDTYLTDMPLISNTSPLKDKLNELVASPKLTLRSNPRDPRVASGYAFTNEGFEAENFDIIESGVLKSFMLSLYGANKTKMERAKNTGGCYIIEPGDVELNEMIKSVSRGVLVNRVSGGNPNNNGDFSAVLKNSFYIENGRIMYPLSETMISTNLSEALRNIKEISKEVVNYGDNIYPYLKVSDVLISGK